MFPKAAQSTVKHFIIILKGVNYKISTRLYLSYWNSNKYVLNCIKLQHTIIQNHQKHVLLVAKLKYVACIRIDTNYAECINRVQCTG
jgi:hypothetical protein